jgi:HAMP domain-containing protein
MSIRLKQLLLLLAIALLPVALSGWNSIRQLDALTASVADTTRTQMLERDRHYLTEKVADIGTQLRLTAQSTNNYLNQQKQLVEQALAGDMPPQASAPPLFSNDIATPSPAAPDQLTNLEGTSPTASRLQAVVSQPSFLLAPGVEDDSVARQSIARLRLLAAQWQDIYEQSSDYTLWHYVALEQGVAMVYPGHGDYPPDYDPRTRPWYREVKASGSVAWLPSSIDASSRQPVLTAAAPLYSSNGDFLGATAIDLPLGNLLHFHSTSQPWLNRSQLMLLQTGDDKSLSIVATREPMQAHTDWNAKPQNRHIESIEPNEISKIQALSRGESSLLDDVELNQQHYLLAVTALSDSGNSWLGLASPTSASETAVARALHSLEQQRATTLRHHWLGAALLAGLVSIIALLAARRVTAPLIAMSQTTEAIAGGELDQRIGLQRSDELGQLSQSIDHMADSIEQLMQEQEDSSRNMITTLTRALEKKDSYTAAHSGRVARYSLKIGERIGLDKQTLEKLRFGAITHDLGKIGIADGVLNKPASLTDDEYEIMRQHPSFSKTIMKPLVRFREYAEIAGSHHEHWDGSGYPDGLKGEEIPLLARIVGIADTWDAMTGDRIYRKGIPVEKAIAILDNEKDSGQFDPELIRVFIELVRHEYKLD